MHKESPSPDDGKGRAAMSKADGDDNSRSRVHGKGMGGAIDSLVKAYFEDLVGGPVSPKHAELVNSFRDS